MEATYFSHYDDMANELSSDLGTNAFDNEIKASFLNRCIQKAVKNDKFNRV